MQMFVTRGAYPKIMNYYTYIHIKINYYYHTIKAYIIIKYIIIKYLTNEDYKKLKTHKNTHTHKNH